MLDVPFQHLSAAESLFTSVTDSNPHCSVPVYKSLCVTSEIMQPTVEKFTFWSMTCVNLYYLHLPDSNTCTLCSPSHARHEKPATGRKIKHCKVICKDICEDKHKCRNIPTAFCWATGNKTQIKPAEYRVHERIQITGSSPNDHTDNKTSLENQYACGNKHVRINRAFSSVLRTILWTLKRKRSTFCSLAW